MEPSDIACKSAKVEQQDVARKPARPDTVRGLLIQQPLPSNVACRSAVSDAMHCPSSKQLEPPDIACKFVQVEQSDLAHKPLESGTLRGLLIQLSVLPGVANRSAVSDTRHCPSSQQLGPSDAACKSAQSIRSSLALGLGFRLVIRCRKQHNTRGFVTHIYLDTQSHETHLCNTETLRSLGLQRCSVCAMDIWDARYMMYTTGIRGILVGGETEGGSVCGCWSLVTNLEYLEPWVCGTNVRHKTSYDTLVAVSAPLMMPLHDSDAKAEDRIQDHHFLVNFTGVNIPTEMKFADKAPLLVQAYLRDQLRL